MVECIGVSGIASLGNQAQAWYMACGYRVQLTPAIRDNNILLFSCDNEVFVLADIICWRPKVVFVFLCWEEQNQSYRANISLVLISNDNLSAHKTGWPSWGACLILFCGFFSPKGYPTTHLRTFICLKSVPRFVWEQSTWFRHIYYLSRSYDCPDESRGRINSYVFVLKNIYGEAKPRVHTYQTVRIWDLATTRMQTMHGCLCNEAKQRKKVKHFRMTFPRFKIQFYLFHTWRLPIPVRRLQNLTTLKALKVSSFNISLELEHLSKWFCAAKLKGSDGGDGALLNYALARDYLCWAT